MKYLTTRWIFPWLIPIPVLIFTKDFKDSRKQGLCLWFIIIIDSLLKDNEGCIQHELVHSKQYWRFPSLLWILYRISNLFRFFCEVGAFRKQLKYEPYYFLDIFTKSLRENYGFKYDAEKWLTTRKFRHLIILMWFM